MNLNSRFSNILIAVGICSNLTLTAFFFSFIKNKEEPTEDKFLLVRICFINILQTVLTANWLSQVDPNGDGNQKVQKNN